jgi:hypothetical protein
VARSAKVLAALRGLLEEDRARDPSGRCAPSTDVYGAAKLRNNAIRRPHRNARGPSPRSLLKRPATRTTA